ncbi:hypothetical protein B0I31_102538 [Saccharothrix carnea]|uniref:Uncharacterized protein n=1 Tax=Saccharothrix carnea TaxID=1280637 RepID=A0A2P8IGG6_SACCR|nr:hypothetical protein [Saccharothrix carnea]PSL57559.1 hypothetical protein B0I31_102538 [Saccharothrix carnea]
MPLADQDRTRWDTTLIAEGTRLVRDALTTTAIGPTNSKPRSPPCTPKERRYLEQRAREE